MPRTSDLYNYRELEATKQQIHLAKLLRSPPATDTLPNRGIIHCELETFDIDTAPEFISLSYTWGDSSATQYILIDNKPFIVRMNLFDFLSVFRSDDTNTCYLWID